MKKSILILLSLLVASVSHARDLSNCQKWGYAPNNFSQLSTISYLVSPGDYGEGVLMPRNKEWADCTIEGVSVPVSTTSITNLRCIVATDSKFTKIIASVDVPDDSLNQGYNDIEFDEPIPVPDANIYVGYTFHNSNSGACLVVYENGKADGGLYLNMNGSWLDYSPYSMGVSGLQVIIGSQNLSDYDVQFRRLEWHNVLCGTSSLRAVMRSSSKHPVNNFDYSVSINGSVQKGKIELESSVPEGMDKDFFVEIPFEAPSTPMPFEAELSVDQVDGAPNAEGAFPLVAQLNAVSRRVERTTVVEEFTGTECGYCPRGWVGMETMKERFEGRFAGVAIHQYSVKDPMYNTAYARLGFLGAPSCKLDRNTKDIDPYNGSGYYPSILGDYEYANSLLPDVEVNVTGTLSEDQKSVLVEMDAEFLGQADGYSVGYALTADGLTGSGAWLQLNYFSALNSSTVTRDELPGLAMFCADGEKGQSAVQMEFNDVMIASSWSTEGKSLASSLPQTIKASEHCTDSYRLVLPTKSALLQALDYDRLYVVAMVLDNKGRVANAARSKVDMPTAIPQIPISANAGDLYTIDGRKANGNAHGIYVQNGRKVVR